MRSQLGIHATGVGQLHQKCKRPWKYTPAISSAVSGPVLGMSMVSLASSAHSSGESWDQKIWEQEGALTTGEGKWHWELIELGPGTPHILDTDCKLSVRLLTQRLNYYCGDLGTAAYMRKANQFWGCHGVQSAFEQWKNVYFEIIYQD